MDPIDLRAIQGLLVALLCGGAVACAPLVDGSNPAEFKAVAATNNGMPDADDITYQSAVTAIGERQYSLALEYLQVARERQPHDVRVLNAFGVVYDKLGRFDLSARYYAQAQALDPQSVIIQKNIAYSETLQGLARSGGGAAPVKEAANDVRAPPPAHLQSPAKQDISSGAPALRIPTETISASSEPAAFKKPKERALVAEPSVATSDDRATPGRDSTPELESPRPTPLDGSLLRVSSSLSASAIAPTATLGTPAIVPRVSNLPGLDGQILVRRKPSSINQLPNSSAAEESVRGKSAASPPVSFVALTSRRLVVFSHERPLVIVNASGRNGVTTRTRAHLVHLGWVVSFAPTRVATVEPYTTLYYAKRRSAIAHALARTVRFRIRLVARPCGCGGLELVVGTDALSHTTLARESEIGDENASAAEPPVNTGLKEHDRGPTEA